ncbi:SMODS-associated and fused to various effectors sensor domain protein [compost metagenome]
MLPSAHIVEFTIEAPNYAMVKNRAVINAFRDALQLHLSALEARSPDPIHVFAAIPAALAIEFGALLTTQHRHPYIIYDRGEKNDFVFALSLPNTLPETLV